MADKLIVALDIENIEKVKELVNELSPYVGIFKIGSILFTAHGPEAIKLVRDQGKKVFLDLKYHDIPSVVARAIKEATKKGVFMLTIHSSGGFGMLREAALEAKRASEELKMPRPLLLGVTVLTSLKEGDLAEMGMNRKVEKQVKKMAVLARNAGLDGVISSPEEIEVIRKNCGKDF